MASLEAQSGEVTIGREADRRLCLPSPSVSRRHAKVVLDGPQPFIVDEGSANGVIVNGVKISGPTALVPGVRVDIAEFRLEFSVALATQAVSPIGDQYPSRPPAFETAQLRLLAEEGPFAGQVFQVPPGQITVGRAIDNDLVFDDPSLSRKHCRVRHNGEYIELEDLGSSNGTFVNGRKIDTATARPGDVVRFGELVFRLEGDQSSQPEPQPFIPASKGVPPIALYAGAGALIVIIGVLLAVILFRHKPAAGGGDEMEKMAQQSAAHLKAGKDKLDAKDFVGAGKEFDQVIALDPTNTEARKLQKVAQSEPQNEQASRQAKVKIAMASSRADFEGAIKQYGQVPAESVYHAPTAEKLAAKLVSFGEAQCHAKKYSDCAWAICRAWDAAPPASRATLVPADADAALREAEKKLARDKTYVPCKKH